MKQILLEDIINKFETEKLEILKQKLIQAKIRLYIFIKSSFNPIEIEIMKPSLNLVKVFEQQFGALCGFHCLYNLVTLTKYFKATDIPRQIYYLNKLNNVARFIFSYSQVLGVLQKNQTFLFREFES
jgi:hypothetical protein